jgi:hypothetical protein
MLLSGSVVAHEEGGCHARQEEGQEHQEDCEAGEELKVSLQVAV